MTTLPTRLGLLGALVATLLAYPLFSATNPVHTAPPREVVNPLYQGRSDAASLAPLQAWVKQRCADGTCTVEQLQRELQAALDDIHQRAKQGHQILVNNIKLARDAREGLLKEIAAAQASGQPLRPLADKVANLPAIPTARVWGDPHVDQKMAATTTSASSDRRATSSATSTTGSVAGRTVTTSSSAAVNPDMDAIATKLKADLATLATLAQQTQQDLQEATARMQQATAALAQQSKAFHEAAMSAIRNLKG